MSIAALLRARNEALKSGRDGFGIRGQPFKERPGAMAGNKRYASSVDVAILAGVSQSAVSRTYKPGASVSKETRRKVLDAAEQLGYRPSLIPRIMLTHRSYLVAIVIGGMFNPINSVVLENFTIKLQEIGHQVLLVHAATGRSLDEIIPRLASYRVDAIFIARAILSPEAADEFAKYEIPIISFNTPSKNRWVSSVCSDHLAGAQAVADLFVERGAKRCAYISSPVAAFGNEERMQGFADRLREHGFKPPKVVETEFCYEGGLRAALHLIEGANAPDAIFCFNDLVAIGVLDAIRKTLRLRVPEDILVAGFDDIPAAAWVAYDLTTLVQDGPSMVEASLAILRSATASSLPIGGVRTTVPVRLVERGTTRRNPPPFP